MYGKLDTLTHTDHCPLSCVDQTTDEARAHVLHVMWAMGSRFHEGDETIIFSRYHGAWDLGVFPNIWNYNINNLIGKLKFGYRKGIIF